MCPARTEGLKRCRLSFEQKRDGVPKILRTQNISKRASLSRLEFGSRFVAEVVQLSSPGVGLNLFVPEPMGKFEKPRPQLRQVFRRELSNRLPNVLQCVHN
jgi:hypothetical protein